MDNFNDSRVDEIIDLNGAEKRFMKLWSVVRVRIS